ncbi:UDP-4-amino-4,6-dideoxy-N-acetyl-beta-L-altrosamine transaminase [Ulvibacter antarcticus]|uniref:UDP-4-amino-4, 6-dideoxy-N-acetyl-beta-L-altrosamine transaminase n=1 Tax=Ulvibacter antarcticus TaxID=442714 RepID=A0A3L9ZGZ3_9FLAO|nr:UDP-4-amino-4,6-dideoxy-N-acetyl-beta-L-altrosamine transaminase [Ulvibacter antarcticus]RMA65992.1 UDP-4-amino-4,6-dideoxy-N-acetyl-beta-L-altrosamine transaminase [Ulvibacter antarcticus]
MKAIPYGKQNITQEDIEVVVDVLKADFLTQGPRIAEFEENFATYIGSSYAVAVSNGTAALHLAAMALGIEPGDRIITTPITFAASANCVLYCGGEVYFADIDPETYTISLEAVEKLLKAHPKGYFKGIVPVDFTGYPVNLEELKKLANEYGMWILEDACHAPGGFFIDSKGQKQGCGNSNYADAAIFSFHPVKHIASGEGGMITTNSKEVYEKLLVLRTHGITRENLIKDFPNPELQGGWYYEMQELGYNYRITDFQAALGNSQLKRADEGLERRQEIAEKYYASFSENKGIKVQKRSKDAYNAHHLFVIEVSDRKGLYDHLRVKNIYAQIHYIPVHLMPFYKKFGWKEGDFPNAENYYKKCISLPMYPSLTNDEQDYVIETVKSFL